MIRYCLLICIVVLYAIALDTYIESKVNAGINKYIIDDSTLKQLYKLKDNNDMYDLNRKDRLFNKIYLG